jgi:hypothetical protein
MNIYVPYTHRNRLQEKVLKESYGLSPCYVEMQRPEDYWTLMYDLWENRQDAVIVEHDILPWPGAIEELFACPCNWCSFTYKMKGGYGIHHAFGCTKFGGEFMNQLPDIWTKLDQTNWNTLDAQLCELAKLEGLTPHPHRPPVIHLKGL